MTDIKKLIEDASAKLAGGGPMEYKRFPSVDAVEKIVKKIRAVIFRGYHGEFDNKDTDNIGEILQDIYDDLRLQMEIAYAADDPGNAAALADAAASEFIAELDGIRRLLLTDAQAGFDGDPAAKSVDEVILSYPGLFAVFAYRVAHVLFKKNLPFIPRMITELAHGKTGIDIHPGAEISEFFFIDHGTSVVIGETAVIGKNVKLYQGVTLGALSTRSGQKLAGRKRHPTIEDNVTIYAGATILGGDTVIGENSVIGGNVFITQSVPKDSKVIKGKE